MNTDATPGSVDRAALDGKARDELQQIAGAVGVKGVSRMKKADLVDAIVTATRSSPPRDASGAGAAPSGGGASTTRRTVRSSSRRAANRDLAALAAEEDDLAAATGDDDRSDGGRASGDRDDRDRDEGDRDTGGRDEGRDDGRDDGAGPDTAPGNRADPSEDVDAESNRRRRRRRGRNRDRDRDEPSGEPVEVEGLLDLRDEGYGFVRTTGYLPGRTDAYVSASQARRFGLRRGDHLTGSTRPPASSEKYPALLRVDTINGIDPDEARSRPRFDDLTPLFPDVPLRLEVRDEPEELTGRIIDLVAPIGRGQRGLVVSPPKAGKTTVLKRVVHAIERNDPDVHLMVLLVDERPEEVTDMRRHVERGEVVASTFDRPAEEHTQVAELVIERAKRLVELGGDVVVVLDGITRLARAYNLAAPPSGRVLSGGVDSTALYPPKRIFGAARNLEEGGSLTILATALVETGSRMDEVIFEEFKGTGNMELRLDRHLAERRVYPAIDVAASGTRHEELLFDRSAIQQVYKLRRVLGALEGGAGLELLTEKIRTTKTNAEFLTEIAKAPTPGT